MLRRQQLREMSDEQLVAERDRHLEAAKQFQRENDKGDGHRNARQQIAAVGHEIVRRFCERQKSKVQL